MVDRSSISVGCSLPPLLQTITTTTTTMMMMMMMMMMMFSFGCFVSVFIQCSVLIQLLVMKSLPLSHLLYIGVQELTKLKITFSIFIAFLSMASFM